MYESEAVETVRPRIFAFVALLGIVAAVLSTCAVPQALAAPAEVKLQVNQNCVEPNWPCWTAETSGANPRPASRIAITDGGKVEFVDRDASTAASVNWTGGGTTPACTAVPATATLEWEGSCKFEQPGIPVSFAVPLAAKARSALRAHKRLALTVQIVITPNHGAAVTVSRSIVLRLAG